MATLKDIIGKLHAPLTPGERAYIAAIQSPVGWLYHEPTRHRWAVYKPIPRFQRLMLRWAFGLKFEKIKTKSYENSWCENEL